MMWKLLRNTKLASALGFLILIALIWFVGPLVGLPDQEVRLLLIVGVMLVWVLALLVGRMVSDRAGAMLEKVLRRQTDDAVIGASAEQRRDVAQLRKRLLGAIDTLKTSRLGKTSGKATTAPMTPFIRECVRASHQAIGVPISSKRTVTVLASLSVSQIAPRSARFKISLPAAMVHSAYPYDLMIALALSDFR